MPHINLNDMVVRYREIRARVYNEATAPAHGNWQEHERNKAIFREKVTEICNASNLDLYRGSGDAAALAIWRHLWRKNRYAGIRARIATQEIADIAESFDNYRMFASQDWDIKIEGHTLIHGGRQVHEFLERTGRFSNRQTIGNLPKLAKIVAVARRLDQFVNQFPDRPPLEFVTNGATELDVWCIQNHLLNLGYRADLTARVRPLNNVLNRSTRPRTDRSSARTAPSARRCWSVPSG